MSRKTITTTKPIKVLKAHLVFASQVGFFIARRKFSYSEMPIAIVFSPQSDRVKITV